MINFVKGNKNCGKIINIDACPVEVLSHNSHNPNCDILNLYFIDPKEPGILTSVSYYRNIDNKVVGSEVYKFRQDEIGHYYSRHYGNLKGLPEKYKKFVYFLREAINNVDFNSY